MCVCVFFFVGRGGAGVSYPPQENPEIPKEIGDKVMFLMAGLAIMTLLINGTTCGKLMHYFGMDRATKVCAAQCSQRFFHLLYDCCKTLATFVFLKGLISCSIFPVETQTRQWLLHFCRRRIFTGL